MIERIKILQDFVSMKHEGQVRKYTGEPYFNHVYNVSQIAKKYAELGEEIGLCHDLFEDTDCGDGELAMFLIHNWYYSFEAEFIVRSVFSLTDQYTHEAYPHVNREGRKMLEIERLSTISPIAQTVKYADIIDNCSTIFEHDPNFAKVYMKEKQDLLNVMREGNVDLWDIAYNLTFKKQ